MKICRDVYLTSQLTPRKEIKIIVQLSIEENSTHSAVQVFPFRDSISV